MAPTVVYRDGKPVLVIGAPGGTKIITSVLQVLLNILDFGMSPSEAVLAPALRLPGRPDHLPGRASPATCATKWRGAIRSRPARTATAAWAWCT